MASVEYGISSKPINKKDSVARNGVRTSLDPWTPSMVSEPTAQPRPPLRSLQGRLAEGPPPRPPLAGVPTINGRSDSFRQSKSRSDLERRRSLHHEEGMRRWKNDVAEIKMMLQMLLEHLDDPTNEEEEEDFDEYEEDSCSEEGENVQLAAAPKVFDEMLAGKICENSEGEDADEAEEDDDDDEEEDNCSEQEEEMRLSAAPKVFAEILNREIPYSGMHHHETEEEEEEEEEEAEEDEDSEREGDLKDEEDEEEEDREDNEGEDDCEVEEEEGCEEEEEEENYEEEGEEIYEEEGEEVPDDDTDLECDPATAAIDSTPHIALCLLPSYWQRAQDAHTASHHQSKSHKKPIEVVPEALPSLLFVLKLQLQWKRKRWKMKCWVDLGGKIKFKEGELIKTQPQPLQPPSTASTDWPPPSSIYFYKYLIEFPISFLC